MSSEEVNNLKASVTDCHILTLRRSDHFHHQLLETRRHRSQTSRSEQRQQLLQLETQIVSFSRELLGDCIRHSLQLQLQLIDIHNQLLSRIEAVQSNTGENHHTVEPDSTNEE